MRVICVRFQRSRASTYVAILTQFQGEEVKDAPMVVPRSMLLGMIISGCLAFAFSIALLFSIGDLSAALSTPTNYPVIQIFMNATQSQRATNVMVAALISSMMFSTFGLLASASRLTWAFARDKGVPFSSYFSQVCKLYTISEVS